MAESAHSVPAQTHASSDLFGPFAPATRIDANGAMQKTVTEVQLDASATVSSSDQPTVAVDTVQDSEHQTRSAGPWETRWQAAPAEWRHFVVNMEKRFGLSHGEEAKIQAKNSNYVATPPLSGNGGIGSSMIMGTVGLFGKALMNTLNSLHTYQMDILYNAIENRQNGQGLLSVSNHQSVADDPFLMGALLPQRILLRPEIMRWGLCSLDICFQNALVSRTLRLGKALPMRRRGGITQPFLIDVGEKLSRGDWVHIFPEGRVRQTGMGYMKRGVGKMLAMAYEANEGLPLIVPLYHEGAETVMPQKENSNELKSVIPRVGKKLFALAGEPVDVSHIFDRLMPDCLAAGGTKNDPPACVRVYEEVSDFLGIALRLLRADLRHRVRKDHDTNLGDPYEYS